MEAISTYVILLDVIVVEDPPTEGVFGILGKAAAVQIAFFNLCITYLLFITPTHEKK